MRICNDSFHQGNKNRFLANRCANLGDDPVKQSFIVTRHLVNREIKG